MRRDGTNDSTGIPVVVCVDIEPDLLTFDPSDPPDWAGFERLAAVLPELRERLAEVTGSPAAFSWFLRADPQIDHTWGTPAWAVERFADQLAELTDAGDEIGVHAHVWRWDETLGDWVADFEDVEWGLHCLDMGLDTFETCFERTCGAHRGGNAHLSGPMLARLGDRGVRIDFSPEPGLRPLTPAIFQRPMRGSPPDYRGIPTRPYRSSAAAYPQPDPESRADPLLVPMFSAPGVRAPWRRSPVFPVERSSVFKLRLRLGLMASAPPALVLAIHSSWALGPEWRAIVANLEYLAGRPGASFVNASSALAHLT